MVILEATRAPSLFKVNLCSQTSRLWPPLSPAFMLKHCRASHSRVCLWSAWSSPCGSSSQSSQLLNALLGRRHQQSGSWQDFFAQSSCKAPRQQEAKLQCAAAPHKTEAENTEGTLDAAHRRWQTFKVILVPEKAQEHEVSSWKSHWCF